ncbi:MAG TPA: hypothetical protein VKA55_07335 [Gammaproteobacteria bacterium]|nr:hypothetical protein [Gammaproteobacteria bacterium]
MSVSLQPAPPVHPEPAAGVRASRLAGPPGELLARLPGLAPVVLRAANGGAALRVEAEPNALQRCGGHCLLPACGAQLRVDPQRWGAAFALDQGRAGRRHEGLRFLDRAGETALSVDLTAASDRGVYHELAGGVAPLRPLPASGAVADDGILVEGEAVAAVDPTLVGELLETLADAAIPARLTLPGNGLWLTATTLIGNPRLVSGRTEVHGAGVRLSLDPHCHWRAEVQRLPSGDGRAHALDLYGPDGRRILRLAGQEVPGRPEDGAWRTLVGALVR